MRPLRLVLVTRRFWPLVGGAEVLMANLASEFRQRGARATILTAQLEASWPANLVHREVPVTRLPNPPGRFWGTLRYMNSLTRWLRASQHNIDLVCCSMLKHDAFAAIGAVQRFGIPVVLRAEGGGATGDCQWQRAALMGRRIARRCRLADAIIAPSDDVATELVEFGYEHQKIHTIPNGVAQKAARDPAGKAAARAALADANSELAVTEPTPIAVFTGRLDRAKGVFELVEAWSEVVRQWPNARLWLVGDGPHRRLLRRSIASRGLRRQIVLAGVFDDVDELLRAADLFVLPSHQEGMSLSLLEAMSAGLPIVATDIPGNRTLIRSGEHGVLSPVRDPHVMAQEISRLLAEPQRAASLGAAAQSRAHQHFSVQQMVDRHLSLFQQLIAARPGCQ